MARRSLLPGSRPLTWDYKKPPVRHPDLSMRAVDLKQVDVGLDDSPKSEFIKSGFDHVELNLEIKKHFDNETKPFKKNGGIEFNAYDFRAIPLQEHKTSSLFNDKGELQTWVEIAIPETLRTFFGLFLKTQVFEQSYRFIEDAKGECQPWLEGHFGERTVQGKRPYSRIQYAVGRMGHYTVVQTLASALTLKLHSALELSLREHKLDNLITPTLYFIDHQLRVNSNFLAEANKLINYIKENPDANLNKSSTFENFLHNVKNCMKYLPCVDSGKFIPLLQLLNRLNAFDPESTEHAFALEEFKMLAWKFNTLITPSSHTEFKLEQYTQVNATVARLNTLLPLNSTLDAESKRSKKPGHKAGSTTKITYTGILVYQLKQLEEDIDNLPVGESSALVAAPTEATAPTLEESFKNLCTDFHKKADEAKKKHLDNGELEIKNDKQREQLDYLIQIMALIRYLITSENPQLFLFRIEVVTFHINKEAYVHSGTPTDFHEFFTNATRASMKTQKNVPAYVPLMQLLNGVMKLPDRGQNYHQLLKPLIAELSSLMRENSPKLPAFNERLKNLFILFNALNPDEASRKSAKLVGESKSEPETALTKKDPSVEFFKRLSVIARMTAFKPELTSVFDDFCDFAISQLKFGVSIISELSSNLDSVLYAAKHLFPKEHPIFTELDEQGLGELKKDETVDLLQQAFAKIADPKTRTSLNVVLINNDLTTMGDAVPPGLRHALNTYTSSILSDPKRGDIGVAIYLLEATRSTVFELTQLDHRTKPSPDFPRNDNLSVTGRFVFTSVCEAIRMQLSSNASYADRIWLRDGLRDANTRLLKPDHSLDTLNNLFFNNQLPGRATWDKYHYNWCAIAVGAFCMLAGAAAILTSCLLAPETAGISLGVGVTLGTGLIIAGMALITGTGIAAAMAAKNYYRSAAPHGAAYAFHGFYRAAIESTVAQGQESLITQPRPATLVTSKP